MELGNDMRSRFIEWCAKLGAEHWLSNNLWLELKSCYGEAHRKYHTLEHIAASLTELDTLSASSSAVEGAIWFHDVIYDPRCSDNEDASIAWFRQATQKWMDPSLVKDISSLITVTDFRRSASSDPFHQIMVDIDLAIFSAEESIYDDYARAIRSEYSHVDEDSYRKGRGEVMELFLSRPIYRTSQFQHREARARMNISRELRNLRV